MSMASRDLVAIWKRSPCSAEPQSVCAPACTMSPRMTRATAHAASAKYLVRVRVRVGVRVRVRVRVRAGVRVRVRVRVRQRKVPIN